VDAEKQLKLDIISLLNSKKISLDEARVALNVSERSVRRFLQLFLKNGPAFVLHGNSGKTPHNKIDSATISKAKKLVKEKYFDFNMTHALEKLSAEEGLVINRETFRKNCHEIGMVKRAQKRRAKPKKARDRITQAGVMLQMDGSPHRWFGGVESCLIGAIDDATSEVVGAEFFESETTLGCMRVLKNIVEKKGLFNILYTDKAGIFGGPKRVQFSQVKRALSELGISIIFANSPQAKGRIERLWGTLQDRMIPEMRVRKIRSFSSANHFLQEQYLPNDHNKKFMVLPRNLVPAWRVLPDTIDLNNIFCLKERRSVKNDHTFSWNGITYKLTSDFKYSIQSQQIEIRTYLDGTWKVFFADREVEVIQHHTQPKISLESVQILLDEKDSFKVRKDSHVQIPSGYYSVDEKFIGKQVTIAERDKCILIYFQGKLIESHEKLLNRPTKSSTKSEHMGPWQKTLLPGSIYRKAASCIGPHCDQLIFILLQRGQGIVDNKSIWGIVNLQKMYQRTAVDEACRIAIKMSSCDYGGVASIMRLRYKKTGA